MGAESPSEEQEEERLMSRPRRSGTRRARRWSQRVTRESNALDLERRVFTRSPKDRR